MTVTEKYKKLTIIFGLLSLLALIAPILLYGGEAILGGGLAIQKVTLVFSVFVSALFTLIAALRKVSIRSSLWVMVIGFYFALDNVLPFLLTVAVCQLLDELAFTPLMKHYKQKYLTNKEIDKRLNIGGE